jgi:hypothetical protein
MQILFIHRSLGRAGRAQVEERYSLEKTFPKLWDLFMRVMGSPRSAAQDASSQD